MFFDCHAYYGKSADFVPNWLVRMMSLASREDGEGLLRAKR